MEHCHRRLFMEKVTGSVWNDAGITRLLIRTDNGFIVYPERREDADNKYRRENATDSSHAR